MHKLLNTRQIVVRTITLTQMKAEVDGRKDEFNFNKRASGEIYLWRRDAISVS